MLTSSFLTRSLGAYLAQALGIYHDSCCSSKGQATLFSRSTKAIGKSSGSAGQDVLPQTPQQHFSRNPQPHFPPSLVSSSVQVHFWASEPNTIPDGLSPLPLEATGSGRAACFSSRRSLKLKRIFITTSLKSAHEETSKG